MARNTVCTVRLQQFDQATYIYDVELKEGQKSYLLPTLSNHDRISRHAKPVLYQPYIYHRAIITLTFLRMGCMGGFISASQAVRSASLSLHAVEPKL